MKRLILVIFCGLFLVAQSVVNAAVEVSSSASGEITAHITVASEEDTGLIGVALFEIVRRYRNREISKTLIAKEYDAEGELSKLTEEVVEYKIVRRGRRMERIEIRREIREYYREPGFVFLSGYLSGWRTSYLGPVDSGIPEEEVLPPGMTIHYYAFFELPIPTNDSSLSSVTSVTRDDTSRSIRGIDGLENGSYRYHIKITKIDPITGQPLDEIVTTVENGFYIQHNPL